MTIEEKAKAYDEALERAKNFIENGDQGEKTIAESIFAGLIDGESEDEGIRKQIIYTLNQCSNLIDPPLLAEMLAWLEKQKELPFVKDVILGYPGLYFYDGERMHFRGPVMEEKQEESLRDFIDNFPYDEQKEQKPKRERKKPKESWLSKLKYELAHEEELLIERGKELSEIGALKNKDQKEQKSSIVKKLREISTPADEDLFEIEKKWESEDNEDLRSFISVKFASNAKVIDGKRFAVFTWERFKDAALELINRGEKQKSKWSEDDEIRRESCISYLANTRDGIEFSQHIGDNARESGKKEIQKDIDWLKSLPSFLETQRGTDSRHC